MVDNYDSICSICGKLVDKGTLYYCCPECHRIQKARSRKEKEDVESKVDLTEQRENK